MDFIYDLLAPSVSQIFEDMYFCNPVYVGSAALAHPLVAGVLEFEGTVSGSFHVIMTERLAGDLTADFLGADSTEVTALQKEATVKELANVLCCATLSAWRPSADFHFSIPGKLLVNDSPGTLAHCFQVNGETPELAVNVIIHSAKRPGGAAGFPEPASALKV